MKLILNIIIILIGIGSLTGSLILLLTPDRDLITNILGLIAGLILIFTGCNLFITEYRSK